MNDKELRKASRKELLEIILAQTNRIEELEIALDDVSKKLNSKKIIMKESGSLAEATLKLSEIFEHADLVAKEYLEKVKENCLVMEKETKKECRELKKKMITETEKKCQKLEEQAKKQITQKEKKSKNKKANINEEINDSVIKVISKKRRKKVVA